MTIKLENLEHCEGCPFLFYDERASTPSEYVHICRIFEEDLEHYLHHPLRYERCLERFKDIFE